MKGCWEISDESMFTIAPKLRHLEYVSTRKQFSHISQLDISECNGISFNGLQVIPLECNNLKTLVIKNIDIVDDSTMPILLKYGSNLLELGLCSFSLSLFYQIFQEAAYLQYRWS